MCQAMRELLADAEAVGKEQGISQGAAGKPALLFLICLQEECLTRTFVPLQSVTRSLFKQ